MASKLYKKKTTVKKDGEKVAVRKELVAPDKVARKGVSMSTLKKAMGVKKPKTFKTKHDAGMAKLDAKKRRGVTSPIKKAEGKKANLDKLYTGKTYKSAHVERVARLKKKKK
jgi:hypothetical protein